MAIAPGFRVDRDAWPTPCGVKVEPPACAEDVVVDVHRRYEVVL